MVGNHATMMHSFLSSFPAGMIEIYGQHVELHDILIVGLLVILEGVLSIDNALVLGILAKRLPKHLQGKALTYGLVGAFLFRFIAIALAAYLLHWWIIKLLGGGYLVYVAVKHFFFEAADEQPEKVTLGPDGQPMLVRAEDGSPLDAKDEAHEVQSRARIPVSVPPAEPAARSAKAGFWSTVAVIELTDIAFAVDSILAAIALVGSPPPGHDPQLFHPKLWVVVTGGFLGVVAMRFAAVLFIRLLEKFPRFETAAYLLVLLIGAKLLADWGFNSPPPEVAANPSLPWHPPLNFHSPHNPAFWIFWVLMILFFCTGFLPKRGKGPDHAA